MQLDCTAPPVPQGSTVAPIPLHRQDGSLAAITWVDAHLADWASQWEWFQSGRYAVRSERFSGQWRRHRVHLHRSLLGLKVPGKANDVAFVNGDSGDHRLANLVLVAPLERWAFLQLRPAGWVPRPTPPADLPPEPKRPGAQWRYWKLDAERHLYWVGGGLEPCYYCGNPATQRDHVLPTSRQEGLDADALLALPHLAAVTVPSCAECNRRLSNSVQRSLGQRKVIAQARLGRHWGRLLNDTPEWTAEQLDELEEGYFKDAIIAQLALRAHIQRRLRW